MMNECVLMIRRTRVLGLLLLAPFACTASRAQDNLGQVHKTETGGPILRYVPGSTVKVEQLVGEEDAINRR